MSYFTTSGRNDGAAGIAAGVTHFSAHTDFPGSAGANEVSGGTYARQGATWGTATGGGVTQTGNADVPIPAATTVKYVGYWNALTTGTFKGAAPVGGTPMEYWVDATADTINRNAHGLANGTRVVFLNGTAPGGLTEGTEYFVVNTATNSFKVAATLGGTAIDLTAAGADTSIVSAMVPESFGNAGTLRVSGAQISLALL
jgi:hypothetical protein